jgi:hypothetical protein
MNKLQWQSEGSNSFPVSGGPLCQGLLPFVILGDLMEVSSFLNQIFHWTENYL